MSDYKKTILFDEHEVLGAKMVPFAGFMMPLQYDGILKEHNYVRNSSGIFDVSHMGEFFIYGKNAKKFIQMVTTNDVENIVPGKAQYSAFCNPEGGFINLSSSSGFPLLLLPQKPRPGPPGPPRGSY